VVDVDPGLAARTDPDLLKVVLRNLISNAIKFTASGGSIAISGRRACPAGDAEGGTSLTVRDEGVGMDPETKAGLFIPGGSRSRSGTASEGGSGLGLVLCRDIAALHGGRIDVESETDAGSAFTVFLPD
jgi:signal transduction histidine kinase